MNTQSGTIITTTFSPLYTGLTVLKNDLLLLGECGCQNHF